MSSREEFLTLMLKELKLGYGLGKLGGYQGRKFLQKITYLIQEDIPAVKSKPIQLGYDYNLYLHGPYSPELAESCYYLINNIETFKEYQSKFKLKQELHNRLKEISSLVKSTKEKLDLGNITDVLELLATVHFLFYKSFSYEKDQGKRQERASRRCSELKPQFELSKCQTALSLMLNY